MMSLEVLRQLERFKITQINRLSGFHNRVFSGMHDANEIIIRVTPINERRTQPQLEAEISLLNTLKKTLNVGAPYAIDGTTIMKRPPYYYIFFTKVKGAKWNELEHSETTYALAGQNLAKLHNRLYSLNLSLCRDTYEAHPDIQLIYRLEPFYQTELAEVLKEIKAWDKNPDAYGIIHGDYLYSNLIYQKNAIGIIDFDDIEYHYYMYDIAVYLFYYLLGGDPSAIEIEPNIALFKAFMKGYRDVNQHIRIDLTKLPTLFRLRQLKLLATIKTMIPEEQRGVWQEKYIELTDQQLRHKQPFISIDYQKLYQTL